MRETFILISWYVVSKSKFFILMSRYSMYTYVPLKPARSCTTSYVRPDESVQQLFPEAEQRYSSNPPLRPPTKVSTNKHRDNYPIQKSRQSLPTTRIQYRRTKQKLSNKKHMVLHRNLPLVFRGCEDRSGKPILNTSQETSFSQSLFLHS